MKHTLLALFFWGTPLLAAFYASPEIQNQAPGAFALQSESAAFVHRIQQESLPEREALVKAIQADPELRDAVEKWTSLSIAQQIPHLRRIFALETKVMGIVPPELVIQDGVTSGPAYFDFDPAKPGAGRVLLNPEALAKEPDKYASLSLLIHETRHSKQFQMAFPASSFSPFAKGYEAAFRAQKALKGKLSFCDFMTLLNEYEAFQFGNYVVGRLTEWKVDMVDMGSFASQYDNVGKLKLDLAKLFHDPSPGTLLEKFNGLEKAQYDLLNP